MVDTPNLLEPKEIEISGKKFIISKFPAVQGMKIITKLSYGAENKNDFKIQEEIFQEIFKYIGVLREGLSPLMLENETLINNHVTSVWDLGDLKKAMLEYNADFRKK